MPFATKKRPTVLQEVLGARMTILLNIQLSRAFVFLERPFLLRSAKFFKILLIIWNLLIVWWTIIIIYIILNYMYWYIIKNIVYFIYATYLTFRKFNFMQSLFLTFFQQWMRFFAYYENYTTALSTTKFNKQLAINMPGTFIYSSKMCLMQSAHGMTQ